MTSVSGSGVHKPGGPSAASLLVPARPPFGATTPQSPPPKGGYGEGSAATAGAGSTDATSMIGAHGGGGLETKAQRFRRLFDEIAAGERPDLTHEELQSLQSLALDVAQSHFTNDLGNDGDLKHHVGVKQSFYAGKSPKQDIMQAVLKGRDTKARQLDSLSFLLRTFDGASNGDKELRAAILPKLAHFGRRRDIDAILPHLRRGTDTDLFLGIEAVKAITGRTGSPQERGGLDKDPVIGPLLKKDALSESERTQVIEAVLQHGEIAGKQMYNGGNRNEVWFITFKETLPGPDGKRRPIRGVYKPEKTWPGKDRAYMSREVAAYEFDKEFARTGLVPPTVEALVQLGHTKICDPGSMQYLVEDSRPLGKSPIHYDPHFNGFRKSSEWNHQLRRIKTLLYVLADPDKLENDVIKHPNLKNLMIDQGGKVWMIDNSWSMGAAPEVSTKILPEKPSQVLLGSFSETSADDVRDVLHQYINSADAKAVANRLQKAHAIAKKAHGGS